MASFESFEIIQVSKVDNSHANTLANLGLTFGMVMKKVIPFAYQDEPSIKAPKLIEVISVAPSED